MKLYIRLLAMVLCLLLLAGCAAETAPDTTDKTDAPDQITEGSTTDAQSEEETAAIGGADDGEVKLVQEEMFLELTNGAEDLAELNSVTGLKKLYLTIAATEENEGMDLALDAYALDELTYLAIGSETSIGTVTLPATALTYCSIYIPKGTLGALEQPSGSVYELSLQTPESDITKLAASLEGKETIGALELAADNLTDLAVIDSLTGLYSIGLIFRTETAEQELERDWSMFYAENVQELEAELLTHWDESVVSSVMEQLAGFFERGGSVGTTLTAV